MSLDSQIPEVAPRPQEQLPNLTISLKELYNDRHKYATMPSFQRKSVWTIRDKQALIDTVLLGDPITAIEVYTYFSPDGEALYGIVDGQQRFLAIVDYMAGVYRTWSAAMKRLVEPNYDAPVCPSKFFHELDPIARNYIQDYRLNINRVRFRSPRQMTTRFLRVQNFEPLTQGERLNAHDSEANRIARQLEANDFWSDFYGGLNKREEIFQVCVYLVALQLAPSKVIELQSGPYINEVAAGLHDHRITLSLPQEIELRLSCMSILYYGSNITVRGAFIAMFQSTHFLKEMGYEVSHKDKGVLTGWMMSLIRESSHAWTMPSFNRPMQALTRYVTQKAFWERHMPTLARTFDIPEDRIPLI